MTDAVKPAEPVPVDVDEKQAAVEQAAVALAEAKKTLEAAQQDHDDAAAQHKAAVEATLPPREVPVVGKHVFIEDQTGGHVLVEAPFGYDGHYPDRAIRYAGQNYEHVSEGENGIWVYRRM